MSLYAFPQIAGVKTAPGHVTVRDEDYVVAVGSPQHNLCMDAGAADSDAWTFIESSIDGIKNAGLNAVGFTLDITLIVGTGISHLTTPQLQYLRTRLVNYCQSKGLYLFVRLSTGSSVEEAMRATAVGPPAGFGCSVADIQSAMTTLVQLFTDYPSVFAFDLVAEVDLTADFHSSNAYINMPSWFSAGHAAVGTLNQPMTCSVYALGGSDLGPTSYNDHIKPVKDAGADFGCFHCYHDQSASLIGYLVYSSGGPNGDNFPITIGELGVYNSDGSSAITTRYTLGKDWITLPNIQMLAFWGAMDFAGQTWGFLNGSYVPRSPQAGILAACPRGTGAYDDDWDPHAVVEAAPSLAGHILSWSAAVGGSGTVTYTPQYVLLDANGFPSTTWTSLTPTTNTSASVGALVVGSYAFRIKSVSEPA